MSDPNVSGLDVSLPLNQSQPNSTSLTFMLLDVSSCYSFSFLLLYLVIYNFTNLLTFYTILHNSSKSFKTLYSFSLWGIGNPTAKFLAVAILSMAGVPPLLGFFAKLILFVLLGESELFLLFPAYFTLLFVGLYFYVQNLRFLNSTARSYSAPSAAVSRQLTPAYLLIASFICFVLVFGFSFFDDFHLLSLWFTL